MSLCTVVKGRIDPAYFTLMYPTNRDIADVQRKRSCSIVSQVAVGW